MHQIIRRRIQQGLARIFVFALIPGIFETLNDGMINILDVSRRTQKIIQYLPVVAVRPGNIVVKLVQDLEVKHIFPVAETTKRKNKKNYIYIYYEYKINMDPDRRRKHKETLQVLTLQEQHVFFYNL